MAQKNMTDLTGKRFGRLKVLGDSELRELNGCIKWGCLCDCGNLALVGDFRKVKSCGCLINSLHIYKNSKIFGIKARMISQRKYAMKERKKLSDCYIRGLLMVGTSLASLDLPPELIKLKRAEIMARRLLKERRLVR